MFSEQIVALIDKLLEYERITTNQHQNVVSALELLYSGLDSLQILYFLPFLSSNLFVNK